MSADVQLPSDRSARPDFVSQSTAVEQARAVAEVQAAVTVAQRMPRDIKRAEAEMQDACGRMALAARAFYAVPNRGNGPSVHLARELARVWGNIDYGVRELRRDDEAGESEVQAFAWDQQANVRSTRTFIVPHARMKKVNGKQTREKLIDLGDIYLSNQNVGARAVRECIFTVLADWFAEAAQDLCRKTLEAGEGVPLSQRVENMVRGFAGIGVTEDQIERKVGRKRGSWTAQDVADLGITYTSITRDGLSKDEVFPEQRVTAAEITGGQQPPASAEKPAEPEQPSLPTSEPAGPSATRQQLTKLHAVFGQLEVTDRGYRLRAVGAVIGRPIDSTNDLTKDEAKVAIDTLESVATSADPLGRLAVIVDPDLAEGGDHE